MRFVPVEHIREGMIVGRRIYGVNGQVLLNYGAKIQPNYISRIRKLGYIGIYIEDDISSDIAVDDLIDDTLRYQAVNAVKSTLEKAENGNGFNPKDISGISTIVNEMLDKILSDRKVLMNIMDLKIFDDYTFSHSVNVGVLSMSLGAYMDLSRRALHELGFASIMHDLGKVFIPKAVLNKPGKLNEEEFEVMKTHSYQGYKHLIGNFQLPDSVTISVLEHHERPDGHGYPDHKKANEISRFGSIIGVCDVFDALTSDRPYRKAMSPSVATEYIVAGSNTQFAERAVKAFLHKVAPYPAGSLVRLSNDSVGIVIENFQDACLRPKVRILMEYDERITPYTIDLRNDTHYLGVTILGPYESFVE
jgi:HD-GYP domain-containing protein (c-di-GMP phosphodiesterase class II)